MTITRTTYILMIGLLFNLSCSEKTAVKEIEENLTWTYTYLKSKPNYKKELKETILKNWFVMDSIAKEKGLIKSYELIENINQDESTEWDFIVAVEYFTQGNYTDIAEEFEKIRESHNTTKINGLSFGEVGTVVKSELVKNIDQEIKEFSNDLIATMQHHKGLGLAAVQVGVLKKIIAIDITNLERKGDKFLDIKEGPKILINPEIIEKSNA